MKNIKIIEIIRKLPLRLKVLAVILAAFVIVIIFYLQQLPDGKLHLIFCDVGQGDAILVITPAGKQMLIDGGPDNSVLSCLGDNLPFLDRNLELMVLTHPQTDHLTGLVSVFKNYQVEKVLKTPTDNDTAEFTEFIQALQKENSQVFSVGAGDKIYFGPETDKLKASILFPDNNSIYNFSDLNDTSIVIRLDFGKFCAMFTGDATNNVWYQLTTTGILSDCFILKIAHHGSKNATNGELLDKVRPQIAVISVGKNNRYGHPHEEVIKSLREREVKILRTDESGTVKMITDGEKIEIKK